MLCCDDLYSRLRRGTTRYRLAGRKTGAREDDTDGSLVDTHRRVRGENSDAFRLEPTSWWQAKRRKKFFLTYRHYCRKIHVGNQVANSCRSSDLANQPFNLSLGRNLRLPGLRLFSRQHGISTTLSTSITIRHCSIPGPLCPSGVCDSNVIWQVTSYLCTACPAAVQARPHHLPHLTSIARHPHHLHPTQAQIRIRTKVTFCNLSSAESSNPITSYCNYSEIEIFY